MIIRKAFLTFGIYAMGVLTVHAQDLNFVSDTTDEVLNVFNAVALGVVTIAIMWAGFGFLLSRVDGQTALRILAGGAVVGSAATIAGFFFA